MIKPLPTERRAAKHSVITACGSVVCKEQVLWWKERRANFLIILWRDVSRIICEMRWINQLVHFQQTDECRSGSFHELQASGSFWE